MSISPRWEHTFDLSPEHHASIDVALKSFREGGIAEIVIFVNDEYGIAYTHKDRDKLRKLIAVLTEAERKLGEG